MLPGWMIDKQGWRSYIFTIGHVLKSHKLGLVEDTSLCRANGEGEFTKGIYSIRGGIRNKSLEGTLVQIGLRNPGIGIRSAWSMVHKAANNTIHTCQSPFIFFFSNACNIIIPVSIYWSEKPLLTVVLLHGKFPLRSGGHFIIQRSSLRYPGEKITCYLFIVLTQSLITNYSQDRFLVHSHYGARTHAHHCLCKRATGSICGDDLLFTTSIFPVM